MVEQPADLPESQDGISCRDETIKLQDEQIDGLRRERDELVAAATGLMGALGLNKDYTELKPDYGMLGIHAIRRLRAALSRHGGG